MTPDDIYAIKSISIEPWYETYSRVVDTVLDIQEEYHNADDVRKVDSGRLTQHEKLYINVDGERSASVYALYMDDKPFAIMYAAGRGQQDEERVYITDRELWMEARWDVMKTRMQFATDDRHQLVSSDQEVASEVYGYKIAEINGETRLVKGKHISRLTGTPVFDMVKYEQEFAKSVTPLINGLKPRVYLNEALKLPAIMEAATRAYRHGIIGEVLEPAGSAEVRHNIAFISRINDETYIHIPDHKSISYAGKNFFDAIYFGPASAFDCLNDYFAKRETSVNADFIVEASQVFGLDPATVHTEFNEYLRKGGAPLAYALAKEASGVEEPEEDLEGHRSFVIAKAVIDNPEVQRFCFGAFPNIEEAKRLVELERRVKSNEFNQKKTAASKP